MNTKSLFAVLVKVIVAWGWVDAREMMKKRLHIQTILTKRRLLLGKMMPKHNIYVATKISRGSHSDFIQVLVVRLFRILVKTV